MRYAYATANWIYKLKGYSKKITQLGKLTNRTGQAHGISFTIQDNEVSMTGAFSDTADYVDFYYDLTPSYIKIGHKYFIRVHTNKNVGNAIRVTVSIPYLEPASATNGSIWTCNENRYVYYRVYQRTSTYTGSFDGVKCKFEIFDLTADFGAGNEPTTVAQCEAYYGNKYIPYGEQILNCKMPIHAYKDGVEVAQIDCGRDLLFNDTLTTDGKVDIGSGKVDLGTLTWANQYVSSILHFSTWIDDKKDNTTQLICPRYYSRGLYNTENLTINSARWHGGANLNVFDNRYDNASDFKTSVNGLYLDYELATHTTSTFTPISLKDNLTFVDDNGYELEVLESNFELKKWKAVKKSRNLFDIDFGNHIVNYNSGAGFCYLTVRIPFMDYIDTTSWDELQTSRYIGKTMTISFDVVAHRDFEGSLLVYAYQDNGLSIYANQTVVSNLRAGERRRITYTGVVKCKINNVNYSRGEIMLYPPKSSDRVSGNFEVENIQLEEGSTATAYEPYGLKSYLPTTRLPLEYQEVAYIRFDKTKQPAYIEIPDFKFVANSFRIEMNVILNSLYDYNSIWCSSHDANSEESYLYANGTFTTRFINPTLATVNSWYFFNNPNEVTKKHKIVYDYRNEDNSKFSVKIDNDISSITVTNPIDRPYNIGFGAYNGNTASDYTLLNTSCIITDKVKTHSLVTCYRRNDRKAGLLNEITNKFYPVVGEVILGEEI